MRESEQRLRALLEASLDCIVTIDHHGKVVEFNPAAEKTFGYRRDAAIGRSMADLIIPPSLRGLHRRGLTHYLATGESPLLGRRIELTGLRSDHSEFPVELAVSRIGSQEPPMFMGFMRDITERKAAEESLRESETRFRQLAENIGTVFWLANPAGTLMHYVSPAFEKIWGRSCDSLYAEPKSWMDAIHPDDRERIVEGERSQAIGGGHDHTYRIIRPDGSIRWIRDRAFPVRDKSGKLIRLAGNAEDITAQKESDRQIAHYAGLFQALSHRLLEVQEEERRQLARELHDEIGQTLTAAKLNLKIVAPDVPPDVAARIEDSIQLLDRLLQQVRQLSLDLRPPLLDELGLVPALRWLVDEQARRARLRMIFTAGAEDLNIDPAVQTACFRVAQEAITNTIRHASATSVAVELSREADRLGLIVRDDGAGFDPAAFQQGAGRRSSLGLISMRERALLAQGGLEIRSAPHHGTEIRAWFPLASRQPHTTTEPA